MITMKKTFFALMLTLAFTAVLPLQSCDRYTHKKQESTADPANPGSTENQAPGVNQMADTTSTDD